MGQRRPIRERRGEEQEAATAARQPTFLGDKLGGDAHLEGPEDGGVVTGDDVIGAAWVGRRELIGPQDGGGEGEEAEGAGPTVGVADDVRLRVRLPQDPVAPGGNVGPHLEEERRRMKKMKMRMMKVWKRRRRMKNAPQWPSASARRTCPWSLARSGRWGGRRSPPPLRETHTHTQSDWRQRHLLVD